MYSANSGVSFKPPCAHTYTTKKSRGTRNQRNAVAAIDSGISASTVSNSVRTVSQQQNINTATVVVQSYTKYNGVVGSFGQFGTGVINAKLEGSSVITSIIVAVKSHLPGQATSLRKELETLKRIQGMGIVPQLYGTTTITNESHVTSSGNLFGNLKDLEPNPYTRTWGIVMERVPISLNEWFRGSSTVGCIELQDSRKLPKVALQFFTYFLTSCARGLQQLHQRGVTHHDLKPGNVGGVEMNVKLPVKTNEGIRLVFFDFGLSNSDTWTCGTRPYSMKYWFDCYPGPRSDSLYTGVDYFQCLVVVMVYMATSGNSSIDRRFFSGEIFHQGAKVFGKAWLSLCTKRTAFEEHTHQCMGWLQFFLSHSPEVCHQDFHEQFCSHVQKTYAQPAAGLFWKGLLGLVNIDKQFSNCLLGARG